MQWFTLYGLFAANHRSNLHEVDMDTYAHTSTTANRCSATTGSPTHLDDSFARDSMNFELSTINREPPMFSFTALLTLKWTCAKLCSNSRSKALMILCHGAELHGASCTASASAHRKSHPAACSTHNTFSADSPCHFHHVTSKTVNLKSQIEERNDKDH